MFSKDGPTLIELLRQALTSTRAGYDMLAPKFDATPFRTPDAVLVPSIDAIGPIGAALDLCCGTGAAMRLLGAICSERVAGIDFSKGMLEQARRSLATSAGNFEFVEADVLAMQFEEEFDAVTCFGALGHILPTDQRLFIDRIRAALKPGGRFVFISAEHPPTLSFIALTLRAFNAVMKVRNTLIKPPFIMYYLTFLLPEAGRLLEDGGFTVAWRNDVFPAPFERYRLVIATKQ